MKFLQPAHQSLYYPARGLCLLAVLCVSLRGQSARWEPAGGELPVGKLEEIALVFESCSPKQEPQPPSTPGLTLVMRGRSQNISMVNFQVTKTISYTFAARLEKKESVNIPSFEVETDEGKVRVPAVSFSPGRANIGQSSLSIEDVAQARFQIPSQTVWAGEVFPLSYRLDVLRRYYHQLGSHPEWNAAPFVVEEWTKPESSETRKLNEPQLSIFYKTRAYAKEPGTITLNASTQLLNIQTGVIGGFLMSQPRLEQIVITSDQPQIVVKALPSPVPATFSGAVGQFKFSSKVVPDKAKIGEPVTWTLELSGVGNWPDIPGLPSRSVSKAFEVIQPQAKRSMAENKLFEGNLTEDVVLMPTKSGTYTLGPVSFSYFDPKSGTYQTVTTEKVTVTIGGASSSSLPQISMPDSDAAPSQPGAGDAALPIKPQPAPSAPTPIPGDPLSGRSLAHPPLSSASLGLLLGLAGLLALLFWASLSWGRAHAADPARPRRAAGRRLRKHLRGVETASSTNILRSTLLAWQRDSAIMLGLGHAAPTTNTLGRLPEKEAGLWTGLWREADRVIYANEEHLPADWLERAAHVHRSTRIPGFPVLTLFAPRHLMPWWFALLTLALVLGSGDLRAAGPDKGAEAFASAKFAEAADAWKADLEKAPLDWRTRHNLGLALLQQGRHNEAVAHLAAAFVQNPGNETIRRNYLIAMGHAGFSPQSIGDLAHEQPMSELARLASPFGWQLLLTCSSLLFALAIVLALQLGYGLRKRWLKYASIAVFSASVLLATASCLSLHGYGLACDRNAALVWQSAILRSVPTEVDSTQKTSALQAGSLAVVEKDFLGWRRLRFEDGQTGWIRAEDLIPLWR